MLYTKKELLEWKKNKTEFYLSKPIWKTTYTSNWQDKVKATKESKIKKTRWKNKDQTSENASLIKSKKYVLYYSGTNKKAGTVTLDEVHHLTKSGIKILAEKNGFAF